ncbi:MAG: AsmA family protein [Candidatus Omnitrophica bacterium]|nr:AsmA family protein [Candidatus Omnitrophota bacterium]
MSGFQCFLKKEKTDIEQELLFRYNWAMHKKPILILLLLFTIMTGALVYLNNVFLPITLKEIICRELSKTLNRNVTVESLYYIPLKGLIFRNVAIQERLPQTEKILSVKEIAVSVFYLPFFAKQKIIIPSLILDNPTLMLSFERTGTWNIQDLLTLPDSSNTPKDKEKNPLSFCLTGLTIVNGTVIIFDKNIAREPIETIDNINIRASLSLPQNMKFCLSGFFMPTAC